MSKHVHADLMAEYAKDAQTTDKPWLLWEGKFLFPREKEDKDWCPLNKHPIWATDTEYRRKRKTHIVNGKEVAAPLDEVTEGQSVYIINGAFLHGVKIETIFEPNSWKSSVLRGTLFATREDALENFEAHFPIRNI